MQGAYPLLHLAQTAARATTVDPLIVATAVVALAIVLALLWAPRPERPLALLRGLGRRRLAAGALAVVVALALPPSVLPYDHLFAHDGDAEGASEVHASHCHIAPGTCADAPVTAGPGQLVLGQPLIAVPAMLSVLLAASVAVLVGVSLRPEVRPPLRISA
jgi:hypothetical protein